MKPIQIAGAVALAAAVIAVPLVLKRRAAASAAATAIAPCADGASTSGACGGLPGSAAQATSKGRALPKLVDLGTTTCAPCKAMLVVVDELERGYHDELAVEFINVQTQPEAAEPYGIRVIPTQVFLGSDGRELFRHTGFFSTAQIVKKWGELGVPLRAPQAVR
jgi:thioredoxin 1